jgi:Ca2+-binding RTX toxin-like protein
MVQTISGGAGDDGIDASQSQGAQTLGGDDGNDGLSGGSGDDSLSGGAGNDTISGGVGADTIDGGWGEDLIRPGGGHDLVLSGPGTDSIVMNGTASLATSAGLAVVADWSSGDLIQLVDDVNQQRGAVFVTHTAADYAAGHALADADIASGAASIVAVQIAGDVVVFAALPGVRVGAQEAILIQGRSLADVTVANFPGASASGAGAGGPTSGNDVLAAQPGTTEIHAGAGNDTVTGTSVADYLRGDEGDDSISGGSAFDDANGNMGNDTIHGNGGDDYSVGGKDNDLLFGDAGNDIVWGNLGNDTCDGGAGNDQCRGGQGDDSVSGGAGNDFVSGDRGNDTISGGAGADIFHGSQDAGIDRVLVFHLSEGDKVMLDPGTSFSVSLVGADSIIDMGGGNQMILVGVQMSTLPPGTIFLG